MLTPAVRLADWGERVDGIDLAALRTTDGSSGSRLLEYAFSGLCTGVISVHGLSFVAPFACLACMSSICGVSGSLESGGVICTNDEYCTFNVASRAHRDTSSTVSAKFIEASKRRRFDAATTAERKLPQ